MHNQRFWAVCLACLIMLALVGCQPTSRPSIGINSYSGNASVENGDSSQQDLSSTSSEDTESRQTTTSGSTPQTTSSDSGNTTSTDSSNSSSGSEVSSDHSSSTESVSSSITSSDVTSTPDESITYGDYTALSEDKRYSYTCGVLSKTLKLLYCNIRNAVKTQQLTLDIPSSSSLSAEDVHLIMQCVNTDFPEFYWFDGDYTIHHANGIVTKIDFVYLPFNDAYTAAFNKVVEDFVAATPSGLSEYELELLAHDYLCNTVSYDTATAAGGISNVYAYSAYGALVKKSCVCEGYSRAMQLLMNRLGVQCSLVRGEADGDGHMWNIIRIDGNWYHLDVTWDDPVGADRFNHFFFNQTTEQILAEGHIINPDLVTIPQGSTQEYNLKIYHCSEIKYNFFVINNTYLNGTDDNKIIADALKAAETNGTKFCEFFASGDSALCGVADDTEKQTALSNIITQSGISSYSFIATHSPDKFIITW